MNDVYRILGAFALLSLMPSCKDDESSISRDLLISNPWNLSEFTITISQGIFSTTIDGYERMNACSKDDHFDFLNDGVLNVLENTVVCSGSSGGIIASGNWSLVSSILQINSDYFSELLEDASSSLPFVYDNDSFDFEVRQMTRETMKLFYREMITDPGSQISYNIEVDITFDAVPN